MVFECGPASRAGDTRRGSPRNRSAAAQLVRGLVSAVRIKGAAGSCSNDPGSHQLPLPTQHGCCAADDTDVHRDGFLEPHRDPLDRNRRRGNESHEVPEHRQRQQVMSHNVEPTPKSTRRRRRWLARLPGPRREKTFVVHREPEADRQSKQKSSRVLAGAIGTRRLHLLRARHVRPS
jgi:hypothetical protein